MLAVGQRIGRYRIERLLGAGGMGTVFLAIDEERSLEVALKVLSIPHGAKPARLERFRREMEALGRIVHPNVVRILDASLEREPYHIVMEYVDGQPLSALLVERFERGTAGFTPSEITGIAIRLADALSLCHERGIIHRDIKPTNVMIRRDGNPVLMDFGLAKLVDRSTMTQTGAVIGTLSYLPPEILTGAAQTPAMDIYQLGLLMYEMWTGKLPFHDEEPLNRALSRLSSPIPHPHTIKPGLPRPLSKTIMKCLEKEASLRFKSCAHLKKALMSMEAMRRDTARAEVKDLELSFVELEDSEEAGPAGAPGRLRPPSVRPPVKVKKKVEKRRKPGADRRRTAGGGGGRRKYLLPLVLAVLGGAAALVLWGPLGVWPIGVAMEDYGVFMIMRYASPGPIEKGLEVIAVPPPEGIAHARRLWKPSRIEAIRLSSEMPQLTFPSLEVPLSPDIDGLPVTRKAPVEKGSSGWYARYAVVDGIQPGVEYELFQKTGWGMFNLGRWTTRPPHLYDLILRCRDYDWSAPSYKQPRVELQFEVTYPAVIYSYYRVAPPGGGEPVLHASTEEPKRCSTDPHRVLHEARHFACIDKLACNPYPLGVRLRNFVPGIVRGIELIPALLRVITKQVDAAVPNLDIPKAERLYENLQRKLASEARKANPGADAITTTRWIYRRREELLRPYLDAARKAAAIRGWSEMIFAAPLEYWPMERRLRIYEKLAALERISALALRDSPTCDFYFVRWKILPPSICTASRVPEDIPHTVAAQRIFDPPLKIARAGGWPMDRLTGARSPVEYEWSVEASRLTTPEHHERLTIELKMKDLSSGFYPVVELLQEFPPKGVPERLPLYLQHAELRRDEDIGEGREIIVDPQGLIPWYNYTCHTVPLEWIGDRGRLTLRLTVHPASGKGTERMILNRIRLVVW